MQTQPAVTEGRGVFGETFFAIGIILTIAGWTWLGFINSGLLRAATRSGLISICIAPSVILGEGIGFAPAIILLSSPNYSKIGLIPNLFIWIVVFLVILACPGLRTIRTQRPLRLFKELLSPPHFKLFLFGIAGFLLIQANFRILHSWGVSIIMMFAGILLHYVLCMSASRISGRKSWLLALPFSIPILLLGAYFTSAVWFLAGVAGVMVSIHEKKKALLIAALVSTLMLLSSVQSTLSAIKFKNTPQIHISGGILRNGILMGTFFICATFFWIFLWKYKKQYQNGHLEEKEFTKPSDSPDCRESVYR
jgi:hypothetical protein